MHVALECMQQSDMPSLPGGLHLLSVGCLVVFNRSACSSLFSFCVVQIVDVVLQQVRCGCLQQPVPSSGLDWHHRMRGFDTEAGNLCADHKKLDGDLGIRTKNRRHPVSLCLRLVQQHGIRGFDTKASNLLCRSPKRLMAPLGFEPKTKALEAFRLSGSSKSTSPDSSHNQTRKGGATKLCLLAKLSVL